MKTMYAIRNIPYDYDIENEATDFHIFEEGKNNDEHPESN